MGFGYSDGAGRCFDLSRLPSTLSVARLYLLSLSPRLPSLLLCQCEEESKFGRTHSQRSRTSDTHQDAVPCCLIRPLPSTSTRPLHLHHCSSLVYHNRALAHVPPTHHSLSSYKMWTSTWISTCKHDSAS